MLPATENAQLSHRYALVPCPVMLPALMNALTVGEDSVNSRVRVAVVPAVSDVVLMRCYISDMLQQICEIRDFVKSPVNL